MAGRDYDSFLASLRLHREQIEEAILVIERLVRSETSSSKAPAWAQVMDEHDDEGDGEHITYQQMLHTLEQNRGHVEEAILAIDRLARGREVEEPSPGKRGKKNIAKAKPTRADTKRSKKK